MMERKGTADAYYTSNPNYCVRFFWDAVSLKTHVNAVDEEQAKKKAVHNMMVMLSQPERLRLGTLRNARIYRIKA